MVNAGKDHKPKRTTDGYLARMRHFPRIEGQAKGWVIDETLFGACLEKSKIYGDRKTFLYSTPLAFCSKFNIRLPFVVGTADKRYSDHPRLISIFHDGEMAGTTSAGVVGPRFRYA
jgi:hypothetical protein